jgi:hypothetical protein
LYVVFFDLPSDTKSFYGAVFFAALAVTYLAIWIWSNNLEQVEISVDGSRVKIKSGDIFLEPGFKAIPFNEYFDTTVDNVIISKNSLNGVFIEKHLDVPVKDLDSHIENYSIEKNWQFEFNKERKFGKNKSFKLGTICVFKEYLLTAFSKFDADNQANLTMPQYLEFLINFWDNVNRVYAQQCVSVPIFGSGITRIRELKNIEEEDLLKIMLWTFRISEMKFKYPAKLQILIHAEKISKINLLDIKSSRNGV